MTYKIEGSKVEILSNERITCVIHHVQISPSHINLYKFLTTSLTTNRRKLIIVNSRKYSLKFNKNVMFANIILKNIV
jgi:septum formation topological specificity factor MinE